MGLHKFTSKGPHRYLHSRSLNDGVQELVVLCHLLGGDNFWFTSVTLIVIQQRDESCRHKQRCSSKSDFVPSGIKYGVIFSKQVICLGAVQSYKHGDNDSYAE